MTRLEYAETLMKYLVSEEFLVSHQAGLSHYGSSEYVCGDCGENHPTWCTPKKDFKHMDICIVTKIKDFLKDNS